MQQFDNSFFEEAKIYIFKLLDDKLPDKYYYHNLKHTVDVIENAETIGRKEHLKDREMLILKLSALFHDVGYIDTYNEHEIKSVGRAKEYLNSKSVDNKIIKQVVESILATKVPQNPNHLISKILCDADLMYLSSQSEYFYKAELLRKEWNEVKKSKLNEESFYRNSLAFFDAHEYHTEYGRSILRERKKITKQMILVRM